MRLRKYHGLGNDYLVLEDPAAASLDPARIRAICDRHRGAGGDGILLPVGGSGADYGVRIYNPDGSEAEKSGNGLRIFARWLVERRGAPPEFRVWTLGGEVRCRVDGWTVEVEMGRASVAPLEPAAVGVSDPRVRGAWAVSVGNPHCPLFTDADPDALPWRDWGRAIEAHPRFPGRTNVQLARVVAPAHVIARIWERGAGETQASGSSACAVAAAAVAGGGCRPGRIRVEMAGGELCVTVGPDLSLTLLGPVAPVAEIQMDERWITA